MTRKLTLMAAVLLCCTAAVPAANIIVVAENIDNDLDRVADDQGLIDWLVAEGHSVDVRRNTWEHLNSQRIAELNAADLIIVSRSTDSALYIHDDEITRWNALTTPLLSLSAYFARSIRWNWVDSEVVTNDTADIYAEAVEPGHPVFRGVPLTSGVESGLADVVQVVDPTVGSGITSFLATMDMGNGRLIARPLGAGMAWIAEWNAGVEFYEGAGQFAGGRRMLFCAGTREVDGSRQGEFNLTPAGRQMLHNAIAYLLGGRNVILVTENIDWNLDGRRDDHDLETFLASEGYLVDSRPEYWKELDAGKIAELNAADLIVFSRITYSASYDDGDEPTQWNSLTVPMLQLNPYFTRRSRWEWVSSDLTTNNTVVTYLEAVEPEHPVFVDVPMMTLDPMNPNDPANVVRMIDPNVGSGITSLVDAPNMGNGRLIAKPVALDMGWIAEWDAGVEFFGGAGQYAGAKRLLFSAGTQEVQLVDPESGQLITTTQGELNLTAEGLQMLGNAVTYLLQRSPDPDPDTTTAARRRR